MEDQNKYLPGLRQAVQAFAAADPAGMARASGVPYDPAAGEFTLTYFGARYTVRHPSGAVEGPADPDEGEGRATRRKICFLHYLAQATGGEVAGRWLSYRQMKGGQFHLNVFRTEALVPLARRFGGDPAALRRAGAALGGEPLDSGDAACSFLPLPRVRLGFILYAGDAEEEAAANIVFDAAAGEHLPADDLAFLAEDITRRLIAAA
ncbi:MAG: DUF3786 domain-containing protein [Thermaerobacter sp.]|nr:DUF3786 domain-containing protein [Thermaerobacter sp.]